MEQLELFTPGTDPFYFTVSASLSFVWNSYFKYKTSSKQFDYNRRALCKTMGEVPLRDLTEIHVERHIQMREKQVGPQAIRHDLMILALTLNKLGSWYRKKLIVDGIDCFRIKLPEINPLADIRRPRIFPRKKIITANEFSLFLEHANDRLRAIMVCALDTGMNECDLRQFKPEDYNKNLDVIEFVRRKTRRKQSIPPSNRVRFLIMDAIEKKKSHVLDFTNFQNDFKKVRKLAGVNFQFRDLRKTVINEIYRGFNGDVKPAQQIGGHTTPMTTLVHYIVDDHADLRHGVSTVERKFSREEILR